MITADRYLIVSLGSIGRRHLRNLRTLRPGAQIAVWRQSTPVASGEKIDGADFVFSTLQQAIEYRPTAAILAGPSSMHLPVAIKLAQAGIHLFIEKPIADQLEGLGELLESCRQKQLVLMVGYNLRFLPSLNEAKRIIESGAVGDVLSVRAEVGQYLPDWRPAADYRTGVSAQSVLGGGVLLELSHDIDYLCWFLGMPDRVTARGGRYSQLKIDVEDTVEILLEYDAPARLVSLHLDMIQRTPIRRCRFIGGEGTVIWDSIGDRVELFRASQRAWESMDQFVLADRNRMYLDELEHFLGCVASGRTPLIGGDDSRNVLTIVHAARMAMAGGRTVDLKELTECGS
jgi:predicted dehydrogenase